MTVFHSALEQDFSNFNLHTDLGYRANSDLIGLEQGTKLCISNKLPGDTGAAMDHTLSSRALRL